MKKVKSLMLFLMVVLIASAILIGCSDTKDKDSNKEKGNEGDYDITMAYWDFGEQADMQMVQDEINKITKEKINATVTLLPIAASAYDQQINLMMTGNEKLDLFITGSDEGYNLQAVKGQLIPLDDLLEAHGQGIKDVVPEEFLEATKVNGEIYAVPNTREWAEDYGFYARKDLLDKYDLDLSSVETFEDLTPIFKTIKENEPELYPIANTLITTGEVLIANDFDPLGDKLGVLSFNEDDKIVNLFDQPEYEKAVNLARQWYEAGYVLKDAATTNDPIDSLIKAGRGFGGFAMMKPGFAEQVSRSHNYEMTTVKITEPLRYTDSVTNIMMGIAKNSENPEKAMEFLNLLYTDADIMNLLVNGIEGEHYVVQDDGMLTLPDGKSEETYSLANWQIGNSFLTKLWEGTNPNLWEQVEEFNESSVATPAFGFSFNADQVKTEIAAVNNVVEQYKKGLESGVLDPEKSLEEFNRKLNDAGIEKVIEEKQKQYDEWKANK